MRLRLLILVGCFLVAACNSAESRFTSPGNISTATPNTGNVSIDNFVPPPTWKPISACGATFYAPPEIREEKVQGIDSCVRRYRSRDILLELDKYPAPAAGHSRRNEYSDKRDFNLRNTKIAGRDAEIISCYDDNVVEIARGLNFHAVLFVPEMPKEHGSFTIWAYSRSMESRATAMNIFETVRFAE